MQRVCLFLGRGGGGGAILKNTTSKEDAPPIFPYCRSVGGYLVRKAQISRAGGPWSLTRAYFVQIEGSAFPLVSFNDDSVKSESPLGWVP